jgi:putative DNA-binding protein/uncharacterized protein
MLEFDSKVPTKLKKIQQWFGSIISRPVDEDSRMNPISPSNQPMEIEACDFIRPSPTLRPAQRIQIYNQQYWWRLLNTMHETFPLVTRMFGYHDFNRLIAIPFLDKYPPSHWSLNELGRNLSNWIESDYHENDKQLVLDSAKIDWTFTHSFCCKQEPPILESTLPENGDITSLLEKKISLQDHVHLFTMDYDLMSFRVEFLKQEPEYWIEHDFPPLPKEKKYHFVIFRNTHNDIQWKEITEGEYRLLKLIQSGTTIENLCQWLEMQQGSLYEEAQHNLHLWFQDWIVYRWLTLQENPPS